MDVITRPQRRQKQFDKFIKATEMLKAISYPYRLEILKLLEDGEYHPVFEIQEYLQVESTLLSHHLAKMRDKGVLLSKRDGRFIHYKLRQTELIKLMECIERCDL